MKNFFTLIAFICTFPTILKAQLPSGSIARYQLDNTAADLSGNGYNGSLTSTSATTNRFSSANSATAFVSGSSTGSFPSGLVTALSNNFTIGYWFKTNMVANSSTQWYGGNAMVDGEMCGGTADWGTALVNGGQVCFGTGNPDITIISPASYNNNLWHFVTATRNMTAGVITLYVDGIQVATSTGASVLALTAPTFLGLGRNPCAATAMYTGSLDDAIAYNRVLSGAEVTSLYNFYNGAVLPVQWISWNGAVNGSHINLQWETANAAGNDHFEIEHAVDGTSFSVIGTVGNNTNTFTDINPVKGNNFYRIRQVDKDGKYTLSAIIKLTYRQGVADIYLKANPVANEMMLVNTKQLLVQRVQVTDMSGRIVSNEVTHNSNAVINIPVQNLRPGYYLVRISTPEGNTTISMMKE